MPMGTSGVRTCSPFKEATLRSWISLGEGAVGGDEEGRFKKKKKRETASGGQPAQLPLNNRRKMHCCPV